MWFLYHFFSISILTKTFFSKFERLGEGYKKGIYLQHNISTFLINTMMRFVGMGVRFVVITVGLISLLCMAVLGFVALVVWLLFPLLLFFSVATGLTKIL